MSSIVKTKYFHGIGKLLQNELGYTNKYILDVLNEKYEDRDTKAVREIKNRAEELISKAS